MSQPMAPLSMAPRPYQAEFIWDVLACPVPMRRLLVAPPGSGSTFTALSVAGALLKRQGPCRILIIAPGVLVEALAKRAARILPDLPVRLLDRALFRVLQDAAPAGACIWPASFVAAVGMDTARKEDLLESLATATWDLVILEEVHLFTRSRWTLLKTLLASESCQRILMLTATPEVKGVASLLKAVTRTVWHPSHLMAWGYLPQVVQIAYQPGPGEVALLRLVLALAQGFARTALGKAAAKTLLQSAASSPLALERHLSGLRKALVEARNAYVHSQAWEAGADPAHFAGDLAAADPKGPARPLWQNPLLALDLVREAMEALERTGPDRKLVALEALLAQHQLGVGSQRDRLCIVCAFRNTAVYLQSALSDWGLRSWLLTGSTSGPEQSAAFAGFAAEGGVLVTTSAALHGLEFPPVTGMLHYDPPAGDQELAFRVSRAPQVPHIRFLDATRTLPEAWPEGWSTGTPQILA